jgi:hypothetical protein
MRVVAVRHLQQTRSGVLLALGDPPDSLTPLRRERAAILVQPPSMPMVGVLRT